MKKKGARDIPDFSHKRPSKTPRTPETTDSGARTAQPKSPVTKPWSTSSKGGRRGQ
jgi:hypothetical protein